MSTAKKIVAVAAVAALGAAGCSSSPSAKEWAEEVAKAGFDNPVVVYDDHEVTILMATAGTCRLRFVGDKKPVRLLLTIPDSPIREEESYIGDPSLSLIKEDERFTACFPSGEQG